MVLGGRGGGLARTGVGGHGGGEDFADGGSERANHVKWRGSSDGEVAGEALGCDWGGDEVFRAHDKVVKLVI
jgi:hypothetical protein